MALSKTLEDLSLGSDTEEELCAACAVDREYRPAVKFCLDCSQPICQSCVDSHRRIKQIKTHKLVDKTEDAVQVARTLSSFLQCPNHADNTIEFLCVDHGVLCCSTCATVNHRGCREVKEVAALAQQSPHITTMMTHLNGAKGAIEEIIKFRQKNNNEIQEQISQIIPKQIQEMKASIMKTFDELEKYLLKETKSLAESLRDYPTDSEIVRWQSQMKTINEALNLLSVALQNGTNVHKYIAAKNTENKLKDIENNICRAKTINLDSISFSFDKMVFLQNANVAVKTVNKSLAEIDRGTQGRSRPLAVKHTAGRYQRPSRMTREEPNAFARLFTKTTSVKTPVYPNVKRSSHNLSQQKGSYTSESDEYSDYDENNFDFEDTDDIEFIDSDQHKNTHDKECNDFEEENEEDDSE